jgi:hypothetical protein
MSCENNVVVNYSPPTIEEEHHVENICDDVYHMCLTDLRNNTDYSYRVTYTYSEADNDYIYNIESITTPQGLGF